MKSSLSTNQQASWFSASDEVKRLLALAIDHWENPSLSEQYVEQALEQALDNPDVLVAAYRYFFYKNNPAIALKIAERVIQSVKETEHLPDTWADLKPILLCRKDEPAIRLYLNAYSASGLLLAKLGVLDRATEITAQVKEIDDRKEFGAGVIFDVLTQPPEDDD